MEVSEFRRILLTFADDPADVDVRIGKVIAQVRDDIIDATLTYSDDQESLVVVENGRRYGARNWLVNRVARLPQLADRVISTYAASSAEAERQPFVIPSGKITSDLSADDGEVDVANAVEALMSRASNPIPGATALIYLTSDAGEGKTTLINKVAVLQAKRFKSGEARSLVVPIPLGGKAFLTFDDSVIAALVNRLRFNYYYFGAFVELVRLGVVVPAVDGYEEMLVEGSKGEAISALGNLVQRLDSAGTIIVAARKAFFEYASFRTQARLLDAIGDKSAAFSRLSLCRWSKEEFIEYGRLRESASPLELYETVASRLTPDHPLLTRAVLVRRLFDVAAGSDTEALATLLAAKPQDFLYTFVEAIVIREASEKWLSHGSDDVRRPLLTVEEHHQLLAQIALEMWRSSVSGLRHDILDLIVDLFCEGSGKPPAVTRQVRERIKQHSLLSVEAARSHLVAFDHEDFQNFYLGEGLGAVLLVAASSELQTLISVNLLPSASLEQVVHHLVRHKADLLNPLGTIQRINIAEASFSFCKENCGFLSLRLAELTGSATGNMAISKMVFPVNSLVGRKLKGITFDDCHFQPTLVGANSLDAVRFSKCTFERLEMDQKISLSGVSFEGCSIECLVVSEDSQLYDPLRIDAGLSAAGAMVIGGEDQGIVLEVEEDERLRSLERFFRGFLRHTHVDEQGIRIRMGRSSPGFVEEVLPRLLKQGILEDAPWRGQGVQRRFKLAVPMSVISEALEAASGNFDVFFERATAS